MDGDRFNTGLALAEGEVVLQHVWRMASIYLFVRDYLYIYFITMVVGPTYAYLD